MGRTGLVFAVFSGFALSTKAKSTKRLSSWRFESPRSFLERHRWSSKRREGYHGPPTSTSTQLTTVFVSGHHSICSSRLRTNRRYWASLKLAWFLISLRLRESSAAKGTGPSASWHMVKRAFLRTTRVASESRPPSRSRSASRFWGSKDARLIAECVPACVAEQ